MIGIDGLIVLTVLTSVVIGLFRGLVVEAMALVVWACSVLVSVWFGPRLAISLGDSVESPAARIFLSYALVFVGTLLVGAIVTWLMRKLVTSTGLTGTDRLLGGVFGIVRGAVIVVLVVLMLGLTPLPRESWWRTSRLLPPFVAMAEQARGWLPEGIAAQIHLDGQAPDPAAAVVAPAETGSTNF